MFVLGGPCSLQWAVQAAGMWESHMHKLLNTSEGGNGNFEQIRLMLTAIATKFDWIVMACLL